MKLSAGAATACLLEEEIPPLSLKETQQTAKTWSCNQTEQMEHVDGDELLRCTCLSQPS